MCIKLLLTYMSALWGLFFFFTHLLATLPQPSILCHQPGPVSYLFPHSNQGSAYELLLPPSILCLQPLLLSGPPIRTINNLCHYCSHFLSAPTGLLKASPLHTSVPLFPCTAHSSCCLLTQLTLQS